MIRQASRLLLEEVRDVCGHFDLVKTRLAHQATPDRKVAF